MSPTETLTLTGTPTSALDTCPEIPSSGYPDHAYFVAETIPDGTVLSPGEEFTKTWRIKNVGTDTWTTEYTIAFADGEKYDLSAEMLRVMSPSAEVQGHSEAQRVTVPKKRNVRIKELRPIGNYAVRIVFDDGHDTGLFTWDYLQLLGREKDERWAAYLKELDQKGLSRD